MNSLSWKFNIKWKLLFILLTSGVVSFLLAAIFLITLEISELKTTARNDLSSVAKLIANRSTAALSFHDSQLAQENLKALEKTVSVVNACIYNNHGSVFATLKNKNSNKPGCPLFQSGLTTNFKKMFLHIFEPITLGSKYLGTIYIGANLKPVFYHKLHNLSLVLLILISASICTFLFTIPLISLITRPISKLLTMVHEFSDSQDYSLRAVKQSNDEVGELVDAFNAMITIVDQQNQSLTAAKDRYLALYNDNPTMIFHLRLYGAIISVNRYCANHLNLSSKELTSLPIDTFVHSEDKDLFRILFDACIAHPQRVHKQELRMTRQDGSDLWVRATARIVVDEQQQNLLLVCEDITETRLLNQKIIYQARHDALTGLANRNEFDEYLQKAVTTAHTGQQEHALCYIDLDQFKVVNDTCGHLAGDELLRQLSVLLKKHIRKGDLLARLGGDEFGILIHHCSSIEAYRACDHLKNIVRNFYFIWEERRFSVGVSIGIVIIDKHIRNTIDALKAADSACYAAKELGRNRVHVFSPDDADLASRQGEMKWLEKIQHGVENNQFVLFGQPIVALTEKNTGLHFEVLLRYQDDLGRFVPPGAFLPAAERYQKTPAIDKWVIRTLFKWLSNCPEFLDKLSLCSINLSGLSLSDETIQPFIIKQFNIWNIPTHKICFEITETAAISNLAYATKFIHFLQQQGCTFSLDDFGSGLSSFAYLKALPVDFLKIDGLFVKDILSDKVDLAMVKSINEVAHVMGKKTIAEFVENQAICQRLYEIGVDYAQGFGIAKPMPLEQIKSFDYVSARAKVTHE